MRKRGNGYTLLEAKINTEHEEDRQLLYKNIHSSCKPKELDLASLVNKYRPRNASPGADLLQQLRPEYLLDSSFILTSGT